MRVALPQIPQSVQQTLGPEAANALGPVLRPYRTKCQWFKAILFEQDLRYDEYREILSRLGILERDVSDLKTSIADLHRTMDKRFNQISERLDRMHSGRASAL